MKNMLGKISGFGRVQQNFFLFENVLKFLFFLKYFGENQYFNIEFVFYSVNIQPDIMKNW